MLDTLTVVVVNGHLDPVARQQELAHSVLRALAGDALPPAPTRPVGGKPQESPEERLAAAFTTGLLLPEAALRRHAARLARPGEPRSQEECLQDWCEVARQLVVAPATLASRLQELELAPDAVVEGLSRRADDEGPPPPVEVFPPEFLSALYEAIHHGWASPRKIAKTLRVNLDDLEHLLVSPERPGPFDF